MTFTEAAVEILRRAGKPLHFKEIAEAAVRDSLLSHVGQDPEAIMGQRLAAMARREEDRKVVAIEPEGTFALTEWKVDAEKILEPIPPPLEPPEALEQPLRPKEREPRPIHAQARRRLEALQGIAPEEEPRRKDRERPERPERTDRGHRRFPVPAEAAYEWLAARGSGATLAELAEGLGKRGQVSDGLAHDPASLSQALLEDNRRRTEAGRKPAFIVDGERASLVEFPPPGTVLTEEARSPQSGLGRPATGAQLVAEAKRATVRALRQRLSDLDTSGFEQVCSLLLERMGMRDVRVAKRSKDGPLYLARHRRGLSDLRVAVRLVKGRREIGRADVQELRKDLAHYSQQMGMVLGPGEAGRDVRGEASAAGQPPVAVYAGESLAEEMVALRVGVIVQTVEIADIDEAWFAAASRAAPSQASQRREERDQRNIDAAVASPPTGDTEADGAAPEGDAQPAPDAPPAQAAAAPDAAPAAEATAGTPPASDPGRRPEDRNKRREGNRLSSPGDQAWGQPAGTPRKASLSPLTEAKPASESEPGPLPSEEGPAAPGLPDTEPPIGQSAPAPRPGQETVVSEPQP